MATTLAQLQLIQISAEQDKARLAEMDQIKRDRKNGMAPRALLERSKPHVATVLPAGQLVQRVDPGMARGLEHQKMRARGGSREPGPLSYAEKVRLLKKYEKSLNPEQLARAKAHLGL